MASFNLQKGGKFNIEKSISNVLIGLGWDVAPNVKADIDAHAFGCVQSPSGAPKFFNDASHALTYAAKAWLTVNANGSFQSNDGSLHHSGDDRTGGNSNGGDDEIITAQLDKLPIEITEISIWITIHEPKGATFGVVSNAYVRVVNKDNGSELCKYSLTNEFAKARSIQVGSLFKKDGAWAFHAIGAGLENKGLEDVLQALG